MPCSMHWKIMLLCRKKGVKIHTIYSWRMTLRNQIIQSHFKFIKKKTVLIKMNQGMQTFSLTCWHRWRRCLLRCCLVYWPSKSCITNRHHREYDILIKEIMLASIKCFFFFHLKDICEETGLNISNSSHGFHPFYIPLFVIT